MDRIVSHALYAHTIAYFLLRPADSLIYLTSRRLSISRLHCFRSVLPTTSCSSRLVGCRSADCTLSAVFCRHLNLPLVRQLSDLQIGCFPRRPADHSIHPASRDLPGRATSLAPRQTLLDRLAGAPTLQTSTPRQPAAHTRNLNYYILRLAD